MDINNVDIRSWNQPVLDNVG